MNIKIYKLFKILSEWLIEADANLVYPDDPTIKIDEEYIYISIPCTFATLQSANKLAKLLGTDDLGFEPCGYRTIIHVVLDNNL